MEHREITRLPRREAPLAGLWPVFGPSLARQGHPTIAHRLSGGTSDSLAATAPTGATESRTKAAPPVTPLWLSQASAVPSGTRRVGRHRLPTVETVGYCRVSLAGQRGEFPLETRAWAAVPGRGGGAARSRGFLRRIATTLLPKSRKTSEVFGEVRNPTGRSRSYLNIPPRESSKALATGVPGWLTHMVLTRSNIRNMHRLSMTVETHSMATVPIDHSCS